MLGGWLQSEEPAAAQEDHVSRSSSCWHFCPKHMEQCSPCREDGISPAHEAFLRKSYCIFMQKLGRQLKLPQVTIATAIVFCHRFFLRQSLATNDIYIIASVCMFLAGKVEETPERLHNVIEVSYEVRNAEDPDAASRIKQKAVYDEQKELLLMGERLVLVTLGFNLNVSHPYKPLIAVIKRLTLPEKSSLSQLAQIAWNFVNDGLQTLLCLQFKPGHVAAGAIYLAAKFLRIKLFCDWEEFLMKEFDISLQQLEDVSNHILQSYESLVEPSANNIGLNKLVCVVANSSKGAANEACTCPLQEAATVTPFVRYEGENQWPATQSKVLEATMEEREASIFRKTHKTRIDIEDARCHTMHSDLTEEKEVPELLRSSLPDEEDFWDFERGQCFQEFERGQCHNSSMDDIDAKSVCKVWLDGRERKRRRDGRHIPSVGLHGNGRDGSVVGINRHDHWVRINSRERGVRKVTTRREPLVGLTGLKKDVKKVVTRRDFLLMLSNKKKAAKESMNRLCTPDLDNNSRPKLFCRKVEIVRQHHGHRSRGLMKESGIKGSRYGY